MVPLTRAIYLDYSASAPLKPAAKAAMANALEGIGNASSIHSFGRSQRATLDASRQIIASEINVKPEQVVFTGGATESNNMALAAFPGRKLIVSAIEHPSILQAATDSVKVSVEDSGTINLNHLEDALKAVSAPALVSTMLVNNETGVIQPLDQVVALAKKYDALVHCDVVQALGRLPVDFKALGADLVSLSAHKIGGPQGVGALVMREKLVPEPLIWGGGQEQRRRAGTENVAAIAGFAAATKTIADDLGKMSEWAKWRDDFESRIMKDAPETVVFGKAAPRTGNISCLAMKGVKNETQLMAFDLAGYAVSSGSACSSGKVQPSHVLQAMNVNGDIATSAIRMSFGWASLSQELTGFAEHWLAFYTRHLNRKAA